MPSVSVIIPSYNRKALLIDCLESVAQQTRKPDEVIVVDDGSSDGTLEALSGRQNLKFVQQENAGPGAARNRGAAEASGDYLAFLDSDDLWFPWSLNVMLGLAEQYKSSLLFGKFEDFDDQPKALYSDPVGERYKCFLATAGKGIFAGAGMIMVERKSFLQVGGFTIDRLNAEDHDLALRLGASESFVQVRAPVTVAHRIHGENEMNDVGSNLEGLRRLVQRELAGQYPGGRTLRRARRDIISMHLRPQILSAMSTSHRLQAWRIFKSTFTWGVSFKRLPYILTVCVQGLLAMIRLRLGGPPKNRTSVH